MKNIAAKIVKVMQECGYVQKQGVNDYHKYKYALAADVLEKVNPALVKNNLAAIPTPKITDFRDVTTTRGNVEHLVTVETSLLLIDADSGETVNVIGIGSGQDAGDKAVMKAETASLKYAWMLALNIATGDDPEGDPAVDESANPKKGETVKTPPPAPAGEKPDPILCPKCRKPLGKTDAQAAKIIQYCNEKRGGDVACYECQRKK